MNTMTQSIEIATEPDAVVTYLANPLHLPAWAPGFADKITGDAQSGWRVVKADRSFTLDVRVVQTSRTVDYVREIAPGREGGAYLRVVPRLSGGSVVIMTIPIPQGAESKEVSATLDEELASLARMLQQS